MSQHTPKRICIIALSPIADDPRVRRQCEAFHTAGWQVTGVGMPSTTSTALPWQSIDVEYKPAAQAANAEPLVYSHTLQARIGRLCGRMISYVRFLAKDARSFARTVYQRLTHATSKPTKHYPYDWNTLWLYIVRGLILSDPRMVRFYQATRAVDADIYLANDWYMVPLAAQVAREKHADFSYDTHEYALQEYNHSLLWRLRRSIIIRVIETFALRHACVVTAVSDGIARSMQADYRSIRPIHSIRNMPPRHSPTFRPCGDIIHVLYHGIITPNRGLEECIASVSRWRPEFHFQLRGPFRCSEFERKLHTLAETNGVSNRVHFLPAVAMTDMVHAAQQSDVGISTPPLTSLHNKYALPNKFFEYIQAGLALAIADLPDMGAIVKEHDLGVLIPQVTAESIAQTINGLTREQIDHYKRQSIKAAATLNWECEQQRWVALYDAVLKPTP